MPKDFWSFRHRMVRTSATIINIQFFVKFLKHLLTKIYIWLLYYKLWTHIAGELLALVMLNNIG